MAVFSGCLKRVTISLIDDHPIYPISTKKVGFIFIIVRKEDHSELYILRETTFYTLSETVYIDIRACMQNDGPFTANGLVEHAHVEGEGID